MKRVIFFFTFVALLAALFAVSSSVWAGNHEVPANPERGKPVRPGVSLWVFVFPGKGKASFQDTHCTDGNQNTTVLKFANANPSGLSFNINAGSIPSYLGANAAKQAIINSFAAWDAVSTTTPYFTVSTPGGASGPAEDGENTVGWAFIVPSTVLAAAWVWVDDTNDTVLEADIFFNKKVGRDNQPWAILTYSSSSCTGSKYDVQDVGTHEAGHVVGLDHLKDTGAHATMYPSAAKGETKKRTLTTGDSAGYTSAGGY